MLIQKRRAYEFRVTIFEGNDEFWEEALKDGKVGADDVREMLLGMLANHGFIDKENCQVLLDKFEWR
jgi:hypothetical protein